MNLIIWSSAVSLITLVILLFNRSTPTELRIPSAFLGGFRLTAPRKLALTRPPILLWLAVIFATFGAAIAYWPPSREGRSEVSSSGVIVWVDDTLSASIARSQHGFLVQEIADDILSLGLPTFGLRGTYVTTPSVAGRIVYRLESLTSKKMLEEFLRAEAARPPSAFSRSLLVEEAARVLSVDSRFANSKAEFAVVSDGQRATLQGLSALRSSFSTAHLFSLGEPNFFAVRREEIMPQELVALWGDSDLVSASSGASFVSVSAANSRVPRQARPNTVVEVFGKDENELRVVSRGPNVGLFYPLVTACASDLPGHSEYDTFGDLRQFIQFQSAPFRSENCIEETRGNSKLERAPWKFRQRSVWLVPLGADVVAALSSGRFWVPRGFVRGSDILVYVAPSRKDFDSGSLVFETPVQLLPNSSPLALLLSPLPPKGGLRWDMPDSKKAEMQEFAPVLVAPDKTLLAFRAGTLPVFYLRTTLAMPNGELTRSGAWSRFWIEAASSIQDEGGALRMVRFEDVLDAVGSSSRGGQIDFTRYLLRLNPNNLELESGWLQKDLPRAGIYVDPATNDYLLLDIAREERSQDFLSKDEFDQMWRQSDTARGEREQIQRERRILPLIGASIALIAVLFLWLFKRKLVMASVLFAVVSLVDQKAAVAQFMPSRSVTVENVPFRVMWCAAVVPPRIVARYSQLRELLMRRGTIRLPKNILGGPCRAGNADFWWTDNVTSVDANEVRLHISAGGFFLGEGFLGREIPQPWRTLENSAIGLSWDYPQRRGMLYRSFYLLHSFDGCSDDQTLVLLLRKRLNASSPGAVFTSARFLSEGSDCFAGNDEYRSRSFINLWYAVLTTDYKEDHMRLPELLDRVRNLGLEP